VLLNLVPKYVEFSYCLSITDFQLISLCSENTFCLLAILQFCLGYHMAYLGVAVWIQSRSRAHIVGETKDF
jgi:hypothetical protein